MSAPKASEIPLTIIAAVARNGVIGGGGKLPWRLSSDLRRFKALTLGKPLVMGRKTFESIGKALPGRETIVVTRDKGFSAPGVHLAASLDQALEIAREQARIMGASEVIIAGGGEIYSQCIENAVRLIITMVELEPEGDSFFPAIDPAVWRKISCETPPQTAKDEAQFSVFIYERR